MQWRFDRSRHQTLVPHPPSGYAVLIFVHQHLPGGSALPTEARHMTDDASFARLARSVDLCLDLYCWQGDFAPHRSLNHSALADLHEAALAAGCMASGVHTLAVKGGLSGGHGKSHNHSSQL